VNPSIKQSVVLKNSLMFTLRKPITSIIMIYTHKHILLNSHTVKRSYTLMTRDLHRGHKHDFMLKSNIEVCF